MSEFQLTAEQRATILELINVKAPDNIAAIGAVIYLVPIIHAHGETASLQIGHVLAQQIIDSLGIDPDAQEMVLGVELDGQRITADNAPTTEVLAAVLAYDFVTAVVNKDEAEQRRVLAYVNDQAATLITGLATLARMRPQLRYLNGS